MKYMKQSWLCKQERIPKSLRVGFFKKTKKLLSHTNYAAKVVASGCCCNCNSCCCCWSLFSSSASMEQAAVA